MSLERKRSDLSIKDKNEDVDDIVFQMICKSVVLQLNVVFLIIKSVFLDFALHEYSYFRLSGPSIIRTISCGPIESG